LLPPPPPPPPPPTSLPCTSLHFPSPSQAGSSIFFFPQTGTVFLSIVFSSKNRDRPLPFALWFLLLPAATTPSREAAPSSSSRPGCSTQQPPQRLPSSSAPTHTRLCPQTRSCSLRPGNTSFSSSQRQFVSINSRRPHLEKPTPVAAPPSSLLTSPQPAELPPISTDPFLLRSPPQPPNGASKPPRRLLQPAPIDHQLHGPATGHLKKKKPDLQ